MAKERIGIMGGTFNPIHRGHVIMAQAAMEAVSLDRVIFLPDGQPPHKTDIAPAEDRWRMVSVALSGARRMEASRMELDREGTTYTYDTLVRLRDKLPKASLFYIIGADTLMQLKTWHRYEDVLKLCTFLVCPRNGGPDADELLAEQHRLAKAGGKIAFVGMEPVDVSSTQIRAALAQGREPAMLDPMVGEYAAACGLYGPPRVQRAAEWMAQLYDDLTFKRFVHTLGVAYSARELALIHGLDAARAEGAALLHDCAKCLALSNMQWIAYDNKLTADRSILSSGALLHAIVGRWMAEQVYGVTDTAVLEAIEAHTTGAPGMSPLAMAVYLADKIEPGREAYPLLEKVRETAKRSLVQAMILSMEGTAGYVEKGGKPLHPRTLETLAWLRNQNEKTGG